MSETPRAIPHSLDAERAVLGALLLQPQRWTEVCDELEGGDFYRDAHARIFAALKALNDRGVTTDLVTLRAELMKRGDIEDAGGVAYLAGLVDGRPRGSNLQHYAAIVKRLRGLREEVAIGDELARRAAAGDDDPVDIAHDIEAKLLALCTSTAADTGLKPVAEHLPAFVEQFTALSEGRRQPGTPTGLVDLDALTCGLRPGLTLLAGRTSAGKTAVAAQLAQHVAATAGPVAFFSLEMDRHQTITRLVANVGRMDGGRLQIGRLLSAEYPALTNALGALEALPLFVDVESERTVRDVRAASRRLKAARGLSLVVVDYIQLLRSPATERARTREEEVARFSRALKALSKELDVPVLALAQLSREADRADQGEPRLSHLRESGALEQDADAVLLLWRPSLHDASQPKDLVCLKVAKNRQGPTGLIDLRYHAEQFRFSDWRDEPAAPALFDDGHRVAGG